MMETVSQIIYPTNLHLTDIESDDYRHDVMVPA